MAKQPPPRRKPAAKKEPATEVMPTSGFGDFMSRNSSRIAVAASLAAIVIVAIVAIVAAGNSGNSSDPAPAEAAASTSTLASLEPDPGFDMNECTHVVVKRLDNGKDVKKTLSFCEAQAKLASVDPEQFFSESPHEASNHPEGRVILDGLSNLSHEDQLWKVFRQAAKYPSVAASVMRCYGNGAYSDAKLAKLSTTDPGSKLHQVAFRDVHAILSDENTAFTGIVLNGMHAYNEGRTPNGTATATPEAVSGPATQVTTGMNVLPSGAVAAPHKGIQLDRCANCITPTPEGGVVTPNVGVIPPGGGEEHPGPGPSPTEPPGGGGGAPPTVGTTPPKETPEEPTPHEIPKHDTPTNTPGPTGNGHPQPVGETEPPSTKPGNPTPAPGEVVEHNPPPVPPPAPGPSPETPSENPKVEKPTEDW